MARAEWREQKRDIDRQSEKDRKRKRERKEEIGRAWSAEAVGEE